MERVVVGGTDSIPWSVCELQFDVLVIVALLVEDGGGNAAKAVTGHPALVAHPLQRLQNCVIAHRLLRVTVSGKEKRACAGESVQRPYNLDRLLRKRNNMGRPHLHPFGGNVPSLLLKVKLAPPRTDQLTGADKCKGHEFESKTGDVGPLVDLHLPQ